MTTTVGIPDLKLDTLSLAIEGLKEIGKIIFAMAKIIGAIKSDIDIKDMGDKALQAEADGITPEKYDTYSDYVAALDGYFVDTEKSTKISDELKENKGVEIAVRLMIEKFADLPIVDFIKSIVDNPEYFKDGRIEAFGEMINENKDFIADFVGYVSGTEKNAEKLNSISETLVAVEKKVHPEASEKDAYKQVMQLRR